MKKAGLIRVGFLALASGNHFLILQQYRLLDHPPRFSVGWLGKLPVGAVALQLHEFHCLGQTSLCGLRLATNLSNFR